MKQEILDLFKEAGVPLVETVVEGCWMYESNDHHICVELYTGTKVNLDCAQIFGSMHIGCDEYGINHPAGEWFAQHGNVAQAVVDGVAPF